MEAEVGQGAGLYQHVQCTATQCSSKSAAVDPPVAQTQQQNPTTCARLSLLIPQVAIFQCFAAFITYSQAQKDHDIL